MEEKKDKKNFVIGALLVAIVAMAVGYAGLSQLITINGTGTVSSEASFAVAITGVSTELSAATEESTKIGGEGNPSSVTTFSFAATLNEPGSYVTYNLTVENTGSVTVKLSDFGQYDANAAGDKFSDLPSAEENKPAFVLGTYSGTAVTASDTLQTYVANGTEIAPGEKMTFPLTVYLDRNSTELNAGASTSLVFGLLFEQA